MLVGRTDLHNLLLGGNAMARGSTKHDGDVAVGRTYLRPGVTLDPSWSPGPCPPNIDARATKLDPFTGGFRLTRKTRRGTLVSNLCGRHNMARSANGVCGMCD